MSVLKLLQYKYVTILTQNEAIGAAIGGGHAPLASFWVRIVKSCMNIKRGVLMNTFTDLLSVQKIEIKVVLEYHAQIHPMYLCWSMKSV